LDEVVEGNPHLVDDRLLQFEVPTAEALLEVGRRSRLAGLADGRLLAGGAHLLGSRELLSVSLGRLLLANRLLLASGLWLAGG
jgi:hypothetical protein